MEKLQLMIEETRFYIKDLEIMLEEISFDMRKCPESKQMLKKYGACHAALVAAQVLHETLKGMK